MYIILETGITKYFCLWNFKEDLHPVPQHFENIAEQEEQLTPCLPPLLVPWGDSCSYCNYRVPSVQNYSNNVNLLLINIGLFHNNKKFWFLF